MTYRLVDRFTTSVGDKEIRNQLRWWIDNHPLVIYNHVYKAHALGLNRIELNNNAHDLLEKRISSQFPEIRKEIWKRRTQIMLKKKFKIKSRVDY